MKWIRLPAVPMKRRTLSAISPLFRRELALSGTRHGLFLGRHRLFGSKQTVFDSKHALFCTKHGLFASAHAVFNLKQTARGPKPGPFRDEQTVQRNEHNQPATAPGATEADQR